MAQTLRFLLLILDAVIVISGILAKATSITITTLTDLILLSLLLILAGLIARKDKVPLILYDRI
jgi:hypothetical protein